MSGPGKFEGCESQEVAERLNEIVLDGGFDDQFGSTDEGVWCALVADAIVQEDDQGFFTYEVMESEEQARRIFDQMGADYRARTVNHDG